MQIKKKADCLYFLTYFSYYAKRDREKLYFTFPWDHNGTITIMKCNDTCTTHRKNDVMWDLHKVTHDEKEIESFIWYHRKFINQVLKEVDYASRIK